MHLKRPHLPAAAPSFPVDCDGVQPLFDAGHERKLKQPFIRGSSTLGYKVFHAHSILLHSS